MLLRDVENLRHCFGRHAPMLRRTQYGPEMWSLYASGRLEPDTPLTGHYEPQAGGVDLSALMREIDDARSEEAARQMRMRGGSAT